MVTTPSTCSGRADASPSTFAAHTLFATNDPYRWGPVQVQIPDLPTIRPGALAITAVATLLLFRLRWSVLRTLGICALLGIAATLLGVPTS